MITATFILWWKCCWRRPHLPVIIIIIIIKIKI